MTKFKWVNLLNTSGQSQKSLIEMTSENTLKFHGTVFSDGKAIRVVARDADRTLKTIEEPVPSVDEGMLAVEKFLFDSGAIKEGDEVEYGSEE